LEVEETLAVVENHHLRVIAKYFLENVNLAKEYLEEILGIEESEDEADEDEE
jgi:hypothetical protein